jgi:ABC-type uncharacterized transport system involved in gliding motility auxiliary subunit
VKSSASLQWQLLLQNTLFLVLLVAAALLGIYLLRDNTLQVDITWNKRNQLSDGTREVLKKLAGPVNVTAYANPRDPMLGDTWLQIREFLRPYQLEKPDIALTFVDTTRSPKETAAANIRSPRELVIEYQGRSEHFSSFAEQDLANLLLRLMRSRERLIMYLDGHGEPSLEGSKNFDLGEFGAQLRNKGFRVQALNLAVAPEVPDNCSVLVLTQPRVSMLKGEIDKIRRFLDKGGNVFWLVDEGPLRGLEPLAESLHLQLPPGVVVDPAGQELAGNAGVAVGIPNSAHPAGSATSLIAVFPVARPIVAGAESKPWRVTPLVEVARRGWVETGDLTKAPKFDKDREVAGPATVVAALERDVSGKAQRVVVTGASTFLSNTYLGNAGNLDLGINILNWLSADEGLITVQPRARMDSELTLSRSALWFFLLGFLFVVPALFLLAGGMIWWRRRKG